MRKVGGLAALAAVLLVPAVQAEESVVLGPRAVAMGGIGVSITRGADALFWNPSLLPRFAEEDDEDAATIETTSWNFYIPVSAYVSIQGPVLATVDDLTDVIQGEALGSLTFDQIDLNLRDPSQILTAVDQTLSQSIGGVFQMVEAVMEADRPGMGAYLTAAAGADFRLGGFGLGLHRYAWAAVDPVIDTTLGALTPTGASALFGTPGLSTGAGGDLPQAAPYQAFAQRIKDRITLGTTALTPAQADKLARIAEDAQVNVSHPGTNDALLSLIEATSQASSGSPADIFTDNQSGADLRMLNVWEAAFGYGRYFPLTDSGFGFSLGGAFKVLQGSTFTQRYALKDFKNLDTDDLTEDLRDELLGNTDESTTTWGLDAGAALNVFGFLRLGLSGRNLNSPTFDFDRVQKTTNNDVVKRVTTPSRVVLPPEFRVGANLHFLRDVFVFGFDYDLKENESDLLPGYKSQFFGAGADITPIAIGWFGLSLRAGWRDNLASDDDKPLYSLGIGLQLLYFQIEAGVALSTEKVDVESAKRAGGKDDIPQRLGAGVSIGFNTSF